MNKPDNYQECADAHANKKEPHRMWGSDGVRRSSLEGHGVSAWSIIADWTVNVDTPYKLHGNEGENDHGYELDDNANHHYYAIMGQ